MQEGDKMKNRKTPEEIAEIKAKLWDDDADIAFAAAVGGERIVAEGDSWFDYRPGLDILDHLKDKDNYNYRIKKFSSGGDTLENMVYGTEYRPNWNRRPPQIIETLAAIKKYKPKIFLFSGGGNDFAGHEFDSFFNHADAYPGANASSLIREEYLNYTIFTVYKKAYQDLIDKVHAIDPKIHIISHGYGYAIPDGRAVVNFFNFRFIGPWLRPTFTRKNILNRKDQKELVKILIDKFNEMLEVLSSDNQNFHYIDLRKTIKEDDWVNEIHPYDYSFEEIAKEFHKKINSCINS